MPPTLGLSGQNNLFDYFHSISKRIADFENTYLDQEMDPPNWTDLRMIELLEKATNINKPPTPLFVIN